MANGRRHKITLLNELEATNPNWARTMHDWMRKVWREDAMKGISYRKNHSLSGASKRALANHRQGQRVLQANVATSPAAYPMERWVGYPSVRADSIDTPPTYSTLNNGIATKSWSGSGGSTSFKPPCPAITGPMLSLAEETATSTGQIRCTAPALIEAAAGAILRAILTGRRWIRRA